MDERKRYDDGMTVRRAVLGDAHVDRSLTHRTDFNTEFQLPGNGFGQPGG